jgi:hypothetical protein
MSVYRVDLLTCDPDPVFNWISENVPESFVVRTVAFRTVGGWYFKCVFKRQTDAEAFHRFSNPEVSDHLISPFEQGFRVIHPPSYETQQGQEESDEYDT